MPKSEYTPEEIPALTPKEIEGMTEDQVISFAFNGQIKLLSDEQAVAANKCLERHDVEFRYMVGGSEGDRYGFPFKV